MNKNLALRYKMLIVLAQTNCSKGWRQSRMDACNVVPAGPWWQGGAKEDIKWFLLLLLLDCSTQACIAVENNTTVVSHSDFCPEMTCNLDDCHSYPDSDSYGHPRPYSAREVSAKDDCNAEVSSCGMFIMIFEPTSMHSTGGIKIWLFSWIQTILYFQVVKVETNMHKIPWGGMLPVQHCILHCIVQLYLGAFCQYTWEQYAEIQVSYHCVVRKESLYL